MRDHVNTPNRGMTWGAGGGGGGGGHYSNQLEIHACSNPSPLFPNIASTQSITNYINTECNTFLASCEPGQHDQCFFHGKITMIMAI